MFFRSTIVKLIVFIVAFSALFWFIRFYHLLPESKLTEDLRSIPTLFAAGNFIYSIFTGFVIQMQWQKWNRLVDANRGELNMLRQLFIVAHHFPIKERNQIRFYIYEYLNLIIVSTKKANYKMLRYRSKEVDDALVRVEDSMFAAYKKYPDIGPIAFTYLTRAMEYREQKLQTISEGLPIGIRSFLIFSTFVLIFGSLFLPFSTLIYNYYFTLVVTILAYGLYLLIDDFDHPLRPGIHYLSFNDYTHLKNEIQNKLESYNFNIKQARKIMH